MRRLFPYISFTCLTLFAATSALPAMAGGCRSHKEKISEIKCDKDDTNCQSKNTDKIDFNESLKS